jgi:hypothetical protein
MAESARRCFSEMLADSAFDIEIFTIDDLHERVRKNLDVFDFDLANNVFDFLVDVFEANLLSSGILPSRYAYVYGRASRTYSGGSAVSSLMDACSNQDFHLVQSLFEIHRFENPRVKSAALIAASEGSELEYKGSAQCACIKIIRLLVEQGADLNKWSCPLPIWLANRPCPDPIERAISFSDIEYLQYLESKGLNICKAAPLGSQRRAGWVYAAVEHGKIHIIEALHAQHGFDMRKTNPASSYCAASPETTALVQACTCMRRGGQGSDYRLGERQRERSRQSSL